MTRRTAFRWLFVMIVCAGAAAARGAAEKTLAVPGEKFDADATVVIVGMGSDRNTLTEVDALAKMASFPEAVRVRIVVPAGQAGGLAELIKGQPAGRFAVVELEGAALGELMQKQEMSAVPVTFVVGRTGEIAARLDGRQTAEAVVAAATKAAGGGRPGGPSSGRVTHLTVDGQVLLTTFDQGNPALGFGSYAGERPATIAYGPHDSTHHAMYVTCSKTGTVHKLTPDGQSLGVFPVGKEPYKVLVLPFYKTEQSYKAYTLWVTLSGEDAVVNLTPDGQVLGRYKVGSRPVGICHWGKELFVANSGDGTVSVLSMDGQLLRTFKVGNEPWDIAARQDRDEASVYVTLHGEGRVGRFSLPGQALRNPSPRFNFATEAGPRHLLLFPDGHLFVACDSGSVSKLSDAGQTLETWKAEPGAWDIAYCYAGRDPLAPSNWSNWTHARGEWWVTCRDANVVLRLSEAGQRLGTFRIGHAPMGLLFDGKNWLIAVDKRPEVGQDIDDRGWTKKPDASSPGGLLGVPSDMPLPKPR